MEITMTIKQHFDRAISAVCEALVEIGYSMDIDSLLERRKNRERVMGRQVVMLIMRDYHKATLHAIAKLLGDMDHSSVVYGHGRVFDLIEVDPEYAKLFQRTVELLCLPPLPYIHPKEQPIPEPPEVINRKPDEGYFVPKNYARGERQERRRLMKYPGMIIDRSTPPLDDLLKKDPKNKARHFCRPTTLASIKLQEKRKKS